MGKPMRALGLMSGTSLDGIDVALIDTDGEDEVVRGPSMTFPYDAAARAQLAEALGHAKSIKKRADRPGMLTDAERMITERHAAAVNAFLRKQAVARTSVDVIGFHGQTVLHRPEHGLTVQLGLGRELAELTGINVVYDLRAADCAAGGQGAPLASAYHRALAAKLPQRPLAILNIGGVANVTWIGGDGRLIAFDTGPGNALLDDWALKHTGAPCDRDGALSRSGIPDQDALMRYMLDPYFDRKVPKSLDRQSFTLEHVERLGGTDGAATLAVFTASSIARAVSWFPEAPVLWIVCGGGRRNKHLMELLAWHLDAAVAPAEAAGFDGDSVEAEAWAYLAVRSLKGLPITFPGTTGVCEPMRGGLLARPPPRGEPVHIM